MKFKKSLFLFAAMAAAVPSFAQYQGTSLHDRIGHGQDSINNLNNISLFQEAYKAKNGQEAYEPWKSCINSAPLALASLYTQGAPMLANLIVAAPDVATKKKYFDDLMNMYDLRIKNVDALNSFSSAKMQSSKGSILCRKAYDYATYGQGVEPTHSLDNAYNMFTEGINLVNEDPSKNVEGFVLYKYFDVSYQKYKADPTGFHEQFLKDYLLCKEVCEKMLEKANGETDSVAAQKIVAQYDPTLMQVEHSFAESKAADRNQLIAIFTPKVEANKNNLSYLRSVIDVLEDNDCDDTDVYYKASEYAYKIEPSYNSAIGLAQKCTKEGRHSESIQYYDKAIQLCTNDKQKARIAMKVVYALAKGGNTSKAESYLKQVENYDPSMAGKCDFYRAQHAAISKNYDTAINYARKASSEDASLSGSAGRLINRINEVKRKNAEIAKANAEYKAALEKQQKLDDFWKGK